MSGPAPLRDPPYLVAVSDFRDGWPLSAAPSRSERAAERAWREGALGPTPEPPPPVAPPPEVLGGYLERLPLACVRAGLVRHAEIWTGWRSDAPAPFVREGAHLVRRGFRLDRDETPFASTAMRGFVRAFGAPAILCVWGLGVDAALLDACAGSFKIYNSIDAPPLRIAPELSGRFDLILTAASWQTEAVRAIHPDVACLELPIGPEFADPLTFRPLGAPKPYDLVYVAAAQPYKRHDVLFDALATAPQRLKALCVFGYGEAADDLRREAAERGLDVDFVGPPGVSFEEVNRLINLARVGVVCGVDDGAPAILTEYMLAGLPVLANSALRCGLQYITPDTGMAAAAADFGAAAVDLLARTSEMRPRETALRSWTWNHSVDRLARALGHRSGR